MHVARTVARLTGRRAALIALLVAGAAPGAAHAGVLTYSSGVLTYTGAAEENSVSVAHPGTVDNSTPAGPGNPPDMGKLLLRENASGQTMTIGGSADGVCDPDSFFGVQCDVPTRFVANLGGNDDGFQVGTDDVPVTTEVHAHGGDGADSLDGGAGRNVLTGGPGVDELNGHGGPDQLLGDAEGDRLKGGPGDDELDGGPGADELSGEGGNDTVRGGDGDDELDHLPLYALDGSDVYAGGPGFDRFGYFGRTASVRVTLDNQPNDGEAGENDDVGPDIEEVDGGDAPDVLVGSAGPNGLAGRGGDDQISGLGGNDVLYGDSNNDTLDGGDGADTLDGGCHDDTITGGRGSDALNSDGTCADPFLRGLSDVLQARDGERDSLVLCTISGPPGDTAIVDAADPALGPGNPGACRTIDRTGAPGNAGTGGTGGSGAGGTPATTGAGAPATAGGGAGATTPPGGESATLAGTVRATLGPALRLLTGSGRAGQAARQLADLKRRRLSLGSLVATSPSRLTAVATTRRRGRTRSLGRATVTVTPGASRALTVSLSRKGAAALRRLRKASIRVAFTTRDAATNQIRDRTTKTFRVTVKRAP